MCRFKKLLFGDELMKEQIELLREHLHKLVELNSCLYSNEIVTLSQELDKLIYKYYMHTIKI